jgi:hypothetical protein
MGPNRYLDIYHSIRRIGNTTAGGSHPWYPIFMSRLLSSIFEWDSQDLKLLRQAKRQQLEQQILTDSMVGERALTIIMLLFIVCLFCWEEAYVWPLAFQSFNSSVLCILPSRNHWFILKKLNSW